jgi:secreted PhoX family phosphatase
MSELESSASYRDEDPVSNSSVSFGFHEVLESRLTRRESLGHLAKWLGAGTVGLALPQHLPPLFAGTPSEPADLLLHFNELQRGLSETARVADGYEWRVLVAWGDPLFADSPTFDVSRQSGAAQARQFGYNCDYIAFLPLSPDSQGRERGLLCVNHEYTNANLIFPGLKTTADLAGMTREQVEVEMAAMGHSVVTIVRDLAGTWRVDRDSHLNRRLTASQTPILISGPVAGHPRLRTSADPTGRHVTGTINNCGGGVTPWGTLLICEENFNVCFSGVAAGSPEEVNLKRYGIDGPSRFNSAWARHFDRFNVEREPNEPNRFGWVVELDPHDPESVPVKRTALGRMKHEGAGVVLNHDRRVVVYCGDDERFEYVYRFVSNRSFDPQTPRPDRSLLDDGVLSVARFDDDGSLHWLPLVHGQGPLTAANGFDSQADVLIETRRAADLLGATPMDRPEDVEPSPINGRVYLILSNNSKRKADQVDAANPREANVHGHVLELIPPTVASGLDHAADRFDWQVFLRGGNPASPSDRAVCHSEVSSSGWLSCPDNAGFDSRGRLWITTDGAGETTGAADGLFVCETAGPDRARTKLFFQSPRGAELSGVCVTPDDRALFVSVQHPGEEEGSDFDHPSTRWPNFRPGEPPRPAVVVVEHRHRALIGS